MRKNILMGALCTGFVLVMVSCSFEIPQSITVKGSPGLYVPLGSPFGEDTRIEKYIDFSSIGEMMGTNQDANIKMYDYPGYSKDSADKVQAYLVHCKIAEMNLNLSEYVEQLDILSNVETAVSGTIPGSGRDMNVPIGFGTMQDWITKVTGAKFTLTLTLSGSPGTVSVRFYSADPAHAADQLDHVETRDFSGAAATTVTFNSGSFTFYPKAGLTISINAPVGTFFQPKLEFEWTSAMVKPNKQDADYEGSYSFTLGDLTGYLGEGVAFKSIPTYIYMKFPQSFNNTDITLKGNDQALPGINNQDPEIIRKSVLEEIDLSKEVMNDPITFGGNGFDFASLFMNSKNIKLDYNINIGEFSINRSGNEGKITVDLVIVLPLEFNVSTQSTHYPNEYVKLTLGGGLPDSIGSGDLFGRTGKADDLLNNIDYVTIKLNNVVNTILPNLALSISAGTWNRKIDLRNGNNTEVKLDMDELPYPFSPTFEMLLPKDDPAGSLTGTLKVGPFDQMKLDFFLTVEAKAEINQTIEL